MSLSAQHKVRSQTEAHLAPEAKSAAAVRLPENIWIPSVCGSEGRALQGQTFSPAPPPGSGRARMPAKNHPPDPFKQPLSERDVFRVSLRAPRQIFRAAFRGFICAPDFFSASSSPPPLSFLSASSSPVSLILRLILPPPASRGGCCVVRGSRFAA